MKHYFLLILTAFILACATVHEGDKSTESAYDVKADISRYLSAQAPAEEMEVIKSLKQNEVSHETIKSILADLAKGASGPTGMQLGLSFLHNGREYSYALFVPESANAETPHPMIVILHGMGGRGDTTIPAWVARLRKEFIILCPTYPMGAWWAKNAEEFLLRLMQNIRQKYPVDPNRVFLSGLSNGAIGAYMTGMFYPDHFAGIVPVAGSITERYMHFLVNLNNTPVYMIQGEYDPVFPIRYSRRIRQILSDMRYPLVYREHREKGRAHGGHFLPPSEVPGLWRWLKKQNRATNSKVVRMTREQNHMDRIQWVRLVKGYKLAALQLPGPEGGKLHSKDGKIATLFAVQKGNNSFEVMGENILKYEIYLNTEMVDFDAPVRITTQSILRQEGRLVPGEKKLSYLKKVEMDTRVLLEEFKKRRDPYQLFDAKVTISLENEVEIARNP